MYDTSDGDMIVITEFSFDKPQNQTCLPDTLFAWERERERERE